MYKFHNKTLPQSYNSFFHKMQKLIVISLDQLPTKITSSPEFALLWEKEI